MRDQRSLVLIEERSSLNIPKQVTRKGRNVHKNLKVCRQGLIVGLHGVMWSNILENKLQLFEFQCVTVSVHRNFLQFLQSDPKLFMFGEQAVWKDGNQRQRTRRIALNWKPKEIYLGAFYRRNSVFEKMVHVQDYKPESCPVWNCQGFLLLFLPRKGGEVVKNLPHMWRLLLLLLFFVFFSCLVICFKNKQINSEALGGPFLFSGEKNNRFLLFWLSNDIHLRTCTRTLIVHWGILVPLPTSADKSCTLKQPFWIFCALLSKTKAERYLRTGEKQPFYVEKELPNPTMTNTFFWLKLKLSPLCLVFGRHTTYKLNFQQKETGKGLLVSITAACSNGKLTHAPTVEIKNVNLPAAKRRLAWKLFVIKSQTRSSSNSSNVTMTPKKIRNFRIILIVESLLFRYCEMFFSAYPLTSVMFLAV